MKKFNLTEWSLKNKQLVYYFMLVFFISGVYAYMNMGRMEDPDFTIREMVVAAVWPGATAQQMQEQVTDKIEKKLQDTPRLDYVKSTTMPNQTIIHVRLMDSVKKDQIRPAWQEVRNMVRDIMPSMPAGVWEPIFNDRFDDVYGNVYALTGDGYSYEMLREKAEKIRRIFLTLDDVKKVELRGVQSEKIYIEAENSKLAELGVSPAAVIAALQNQGGVVSSGKLDSSSNRMYMRVSGLFENIDDIRNMPITSGKTVFRLGDIAKVTRGYSDPHDSRMFFNGKPAVGLALSMYSGGNILNLAKELEKTVTQIKTELPVGMDISKVANQPEVVRDSINEFVESLAEAILIVLIVCFIFLGLRSGTVVALCIPLVILGSFTFMYLLGIDLHKVSLGALIIALGLLVDDEIIAIEMMSVKLEQGWSRDDAAIFSYTSTAFPRLTGALVTCAGFIPMALSQGSASEYCQSLFYVIVIALLLSWLVAGTVTPLIGHRFIRVKVFEKADDIYDTKFYRKFRSLLVWFLHHRKTVLLATALCFVGSILLLTQIKSEFFPAAVRPELSVDLKLPAGASIAATEQAAAKLSSYIEKDDLVESYSYYTGDGAPRFVLCFEPETPRPNFAQFVIVAKSADARNKLQEKLTKILEEKFAGVDSNLRVLPTGIPSPYPVMLRVSGYDNDKVRELSAQVRSEMIKNPGVYSTTYDWYEKSPSVQLKIDQDKARLLGLSNNFLQNTLQVQLSGYAVTQFLERDRTIDVTLRIDAKDRNALSKLKNINIFTGTGKVVPLDSIAEITVVPEDGLLMRRNLKPTITVQAAVKPGFMGNNVTQDVYNKLAAVRSNLPVGYSVEIDGPLENTSKSTGYLLQTVPVMLLAIITLLIFQLRNIPRVLLTLLTAPLGIIGVSLGLFLTGKPIGFVVELGILALFGIIMRNSVILIDQIDQQFALGNNLWDSVINATVMRFRPIMLTAAAAILGMLPLIPSVFWGPMAIAIAAGLFGATILTLLVLPVMYAAWYKIRPQESP